jgi:hypothetical protein
MCSAGTVHVHAKRSSQRRFAVYPSVLELAAHAMSNTQRRNFELKLTLLM